MARGDAFGGVPRTTTAFSEDGVEMRADEFNEPYERFEVLAEVLDEDLQEFLFMYRVAIGDAAETWHRELSGAAGMLINHATNDVFILLDSVERSDGRTAARTARALYEHLLHYREVHRDPPKATQYEDHRHVTADQLARREIGLRRLKGGQRRKERDLLRRLGRQAQAPLANAIARYGADFRRGWTAGTSLHALATRHNLLDDYDSYRILSGVMHGSAGALLGTRRESRGIITHRLGADLRLAPLAFHEGLTWWRKMLDDLPATTPAPGWSVDLRDATDLLLAEYPRLHAAARRLDNRMWPVGAAPARKLTVLAVYPGGKVRWFLHDLSSGAMWLAELDQEEPEGYKETVARMSKVPSDGARPVTAVMLDVRVNPLAGRRPVSANQLLLAHDVFGPMTYQRLEETDTGKG